MSDVGSGDTERALTLRYGELAERDKQYWGRWIDERHDQLNAQFTSTGDRAIRYLTLTNGGAAVALAAFMGTSDALRRSTAAWIAQGSFLLGVIAVGALLALRYHWFGDLIDLFRADAQRVYRNELSLQEIDQNDHLRSRTHTAAAVALGYAAFVSFIFGALVAVAFVR